MKYYYKENSELEQKVQQIEELMDKLQISLSQGYNGIIISYQSKDVAVIQDTEQPDITTTFPRTFDTERLEVINKVYDENENARREESS